MSSYNREHTSGVLGSGERVECIHDVFSDPHRQAILYYLQESEEPVTLCDVTRTVTTWVEPDGSTGIADRTTAWLLHTHVLAMEAFGLLDYDPEADTIALSDDVAITVSPPPNAV